MSCSHHMTKVRIKPRWRWELVCILIHTCQNQSDLHIISGFSSTNYVLFSDQCVFIRTLWRKSIHQRWLWRCLAALHSMSSAFQLRQKGQSKQTVHRERSLICPRTSLSLTSGSGSRPRRHNSGSDGEWCHHSGLMGLDLARLIVLNGVSVAPNDSGYSRLH